MPAAIASTKPGAMEPIAEGSSQSNMLETIEDDSAAPHDESNKVIGQAVKQEEVNQEVEQEEAEEEVEQKKEDISLEDLPLSYKQNDNKEELVIAYAENFRRQYVHLFRDRQPLILYPLNECGVEKLVCTTMKPTLLPFKQLYHWQGCAEFVSDYITMEQLPVAYKVPETLSSPTTVLRKQTGTCFDMSNLLCCLLLGAGYDAYVVSGYATKEICLADETREICPLLKPKEEEEEDAKKKQTKKYTVRPSRDLTSKYERKMKLREEAKERERQEQVKRKEEERLLELEKASPDPLYGLRVHSWILIKAGKREVPDDFFIEPFTGRDYPQTSTSFLGIESVWNHTNYWANMQDCSNGCADLNFNLYNTVYWEYLMEGVVSTQDDTNEDTLDDEDDDGEDTKDEPASLDVPASWILPIEITAKQIESRCPEGRKTILYKKALVEKYAQYLLPDGLVTRLQVFNDIEQKELVRKEEYFMNRVDKLQRRVDEDGFITEEFAQGRLCGLKSHRYKKNDSEPFGERTMHFYHHIRVDGMSMRSETSTEMIENYTDREDRRYFRRVLFGPPVKKSSAVKDHLQRPILKVTEKYSRNKEVEANEDVDTLVFVIAEDKITLKYHRNKEAITASTREYYKPSDADEKGESLVWTNEMTQSFQVLLPDSKPPSKKTVPIYQNMIDLIKKEQKTVKSVRLSEEETEEILQERIEQCLANDLVVSVYDTERNDKALKHRQEQERIAEEEKNKKKESEMDYLAPFLQQIGCPNRLTSAQAFKLKEDCLSDLKQRLIDKANLIQLRFEKETSELHKRQQEYQHKQVAMTKEDEEEYFNYCSEAMFRIHILEMRLNRHKQTAPNKYMAMEQKLRQDKRLSDLLL